MVLSLECSYNRTLLPYLIVKELLGEVTGLLEVEERRSNNYKHFLKEVEDDGGYWTIDVPSIAY